MLVLISALGIVGGILAFALTTDKGKNTVHARRAQQAMTIQSK